MYSLLNKYLSIVCHIMSLCCNHNTTPILTLTTSYQVHSLHSLSSLMLVALRLSRDEEGVLFLDGIIDRDKRALELRDRATTKLVNQGTCVHNLSTILDREILSQHHLSGKVPPCLVLGEVECPRRVIE